MLNGITHRLSRSFLVACAAATCVLAASAPAIASPGHDHCRERIVVRGNVQFGGPSRAPAPRYSRYVAHGDACGCFDCCAKRDFARGLNRGEAAGANQGFRDGINGKAFCADVRDDLCRESQAFRDGYIKAFGDSYRCAYERGRMERSRACAPAYRPRCPW